MIISMQNTTKAIELKAILDNLRPINNEQEARIMQKFRLDWNYHSNHLEGNTLTYGETKALILFGITAQGKPLKDHFEITGHNEAINWVIDVVKGEYPLTEKFIRELHTLLLKEPYEVDAITPDGKPTKKKIHVGSYKTSANHVKTKTGEIFYFATPEETPAKMYDLLSWYNEKVKENLNPILLAAEFHYKFIRIHPFDDGNGRTARILMNFILMKFGYPPVIIKTQDKDNYFAVLQLADAGNLEAFLEYIAQNLVSSLEIMIAGANGEDIEEEDDLDKEIALLEQRMLSVGNVIRVEMNNENIQKIIDKCILELIKNIHNKFKSFEKHYLNNNIIFQVGNHQYKYDEFEPFQVVLQGDFSSNQIYITYGGLKISNLEDFLFFVRINIIFDQLKYSIQTDDKTIGINISKNYNQILNKKEADNIVARLVRHHNKLLEEEISKKESK